MLKLLLNLTVGLDPRLSSLLMLAINLVTDVAQVEAALLVPVAELEFGLAGSDDRIEAGILGARRRSAGTNRLIRLASDVDEEAVDGVFARPRHVLAVEIAWTRMYLVHMAAPNCWIFPNLLPLSL